MLIFFFFPAKWENKMCDLKTGGWKNLEEKQRTAKGKGRAWFVFPFEIKHWRWPEVVIANCAERVGATGKCTYLNSNCDYFLLFFFHVFQLEVAGVLLFFFVTLSPRLVDDGSFFFCMTPVGNQRRELKFIAGALYPVWYETQMKVLKKKKRKKERKRQVSWSDSGI